MTLRIRPYILAGGRSSRMGRDKAMLELEGKTLLARAVETLRSVKDFQLEGGGVEVAICGERDELEGADRAIKDRYPLCGPLGGIEAALSDLKTSEGPDWAFFIPVDIPLISAALIAQLLAGWSSECLQNRKIKACLMEVEGKPQPLISLVHRSALGLVREALESGRYKVLPILQSGGACCTYVGDEPGSPGGILKPLPRWVSVNRLHLASEAKEAAAGASLFRAFRDQFVNVNTEADLFRVATLLKHKGSQYQPEVPAR